MVIKHRRIWTLLVFTSLFLQPAIGHAGLIWKAAATQRLVVTRN